jgi:tetratricopeptide (TPR) repeat protein
MIEIPASLLERLKRRQVVLVAGLGCSELAGAPGWSELALRLADRVPDEARRTELKVLVAVGRRAAAIEYLGARLPPEAIERVLQEAYPVRARAPEAIAALARFPWRGMISTGCDALWATAARQSHDGDGDDQGDGGGGATDAGLQLFAASEGPALAHHRGRFLWHLGGTTDAPESLGVGAAQVRRLAAMGAAAALRGLAEGRSFLFIGFRPGDPDLVMVKQLAGALGGGPHLLVTWGARELETDVVEAELGVTAVTHPGTLEEAMRALHAALAEAAAQARPAEDDVDGWLELWRSDPQDPEPREMLERAEARMRAERRWQPLVELLLKRVELGTDRAERVAMLRAVAHLYDGPLDSRDHAFAAMSTAFRLDPDAKGLQTEVRRVTSRSGRWRDLAGVYAIVCMELGDAPTAPVHRLELARIHAEELRQTEEAIVHYRAVLDADPRNARAAHALADLIGPLGRWTELGPALGLAADLEEDPGRARELRLRLAELQATRLADAEAATATYERVLADDVASGVLPMPTEALDALERLYRRAERWPELARVLGERAARAGDPAAAARVRRERADVLAERVGDLGAAIGDLEAVVAHDPGDRAALRALEGLYGREGRDSDQLKMMAQLADLPSSDTERLALLRRLAAEWEKKPEGLDAAATALDKILRLDPRDGEAIVGLQRVYRAARRWPEVIETLTRQIAVTHGSKERGELWATIGVVYDQELREGAGAAKAYAAAVALGDEREGTVAALARLEREAKRWAPAMEALGTLARVAREPVARAEALLRAAEIAAGPIGDAAAAEGYYARVLDGDPSHVTAATALVGLQRARGDFARAGKLLRDAEARAATARDKATLLHELGVLQQDDLGDVAQAALLFERALALDPDGGAASTERLVALHARAGRWEALDPLLESLARPSAPGAGPRTKGAEVYIGLGQGAQRLGKLDTALRAYEVARRRAPDSLAVLRGFGELRMQRNEWSEAEALYRAALDGHRDALSPAEQVDAWSRLGRCRAALGDGDGALDCYGKALALDPGNRAALEAVAALHVENGDFAALVRDKRALLELARDDDTRIRLNEEIGDLQLEKLSNPAEAIRSYQAALALAPGRGPTLHRLIALYTKEKRWREAARTLVRLADLDKAPAVKAKYLYAAAVIYRDELGDADWAVALFNRALDQTPDMTMAFDAIERMLVEAAAWKQLGRNYRKMIERLDAADPAGTPLRLRLWSALGDVSLVHLGDPETAVAALETAAALDGGNVQRHEQLAEVYFQAGPDHHQKAIAEHQWLLARDPDRLASYRALAELYAETNALDKLWCVAGTLSFIRKADPELKRYYEQHKPRELRTAKRAFDQEIWERVVHPDEDRFMTALFMLLGQFMAGVAAQSHQAVGLKRRERVNVATDDRLAARLLRYVAGTLELPAPDLFFRESEPGTLHLYNLQEKGVLTPALVVGRGIVQRESESELVFDIGKRVTFLRPERFVRYASSSPAALDIAVRAALALAGSPIGNGPHNGEVDKLTGELRRLVPKPVMDRLVLLGHELAAGRGESIDAQAWQAGADLTAGRVGFVLTSDLKAAARVISSEPPGTSPLTSKQRLKDLLAYSVSEDYFAVRKALGLQVV